MVEISGVPWLYRTAKKEAAKDRLKTAEMIGDVIAIAVIMIFIAYFANSQASNSGFFTDRFGSAEAFFFYAVAITGLLPPALRLVLRRRNAVRPVEIFNSIFAIVSLMYLLSVFPFDFAFLAPTSLQSVFSWRSSASGRMWGSPPHSSIACATS